MNKKGKGPNLTWIFIGVAIAIVVLSLSFNSYETFLTDNNVSMDSKFTGASGNITRIQGNITALGGDLKDKDLLSEVWDAGIGTVNIFVMGLAAIGKFFKMIPILSDILILMQSVIPGFEPLIGLFTIIIAVYISLSVLKAKRGTTENA